MKAKTTRQIKLQSQHRALTYHDKEVPQLKISGVWLEKVGFRADGHVIITVEHEKLTIQPAYATSFVKTTEVKKASAGKPAR